MQINGMEIMNAGSPIASGAEGKIRDGENAKDANGAVDPALFGALLLLSQAQNQGTNPEKTQEGLKEVEGGVQGNPAKDGLAQKIQTLEMEAQSQASTQAKALGQPAKEGNIPVATSLNTPSALDLAALGPMLEAARSQKASSTQVRNPLEGVKTSTKANLGVVGGGTTQGMLMAGAAKPEVGAQNLLVEAMPSSEAPYQNSILNMARSNAVESSALQQQQAVAGPVLQGSGFSKASSGQGILGGEEYADLKKSVLELKDGKVSSRSALEGKAAQEAAPTMTSQAVNGIGERPAVRKKGDGKQSWGEMSPNLAPQVAHPMNGQPIVRPTVGPMISGLSAHVVPGSMGKNRLTSEALVNLTNQIGGHVRVGESGGEIRVRLKPENLGELNVQVFTHGNRVALRIQASDDKAKRVIEESMGYLKESLATQRLELGRVEVAVAGSVSGNSLAASNSFQSDMSSQQQFGSSLAWDQSQQQMSGQGNEGRYPQQQSSRYSEEPVVTGIPSYRPTGARTASGGIDVRA